MSFDFNKIHKRLSLLTLFWGAPLLGTLSCAFSSPEAAIQRTEQDLNDRGYLPTLEVKQEIRSLLQGEISVDQAVGISFACSPTLKSLYKRLGVDNADLSQAFLPENPSLSLERRFPGKAAELDVAQELLSLFLLRMKQEISESEFESRRNLLAHELASHATLVRKTFFQYQANLELREFRKRIALTRESDYLAAQELLRAGNRSQLELLQSKRENKLAEVDLLDAELEVQKSREDLQRLLGVAEHERHWSIASRLPLPLHQEMGEAELEEKALHDRFDLQALRAEVKALEDNRSYVNIISRIPTLTLGGHSEREPEGDSSFGPSILIPIPIFNFGGAMREKARLLVEEANQRLLAKEIEIRWEVRKHLLSMNLIAKKVDLYREQILPTQKQITAETQLRYNGMFLGVFDLLEAKRKEIEAGEAHIHNLFAYWTERSELEEALGWRLQGNVAAAPPAEEGKDGTPHPMQHHEMHHHGGQ